MKKLMIIGMVCAMLLAGCSSNESNNNTDDEDWTYDKLEKEFGGIIETDFSSTKKYLELIENANFKVCGMVIKKEKRSFFGSDSWCLRITDDKNNSYSDNTINVYVTEYAFQNVSEGDVIYAIGNANYVDYGIPELENTIQLSCDNEDSIYTEEIEGYTSVMEYVNTVKEISEDTYFQTEGLIIKDGSSYNLYESKEAYKENKYGYIRLKFAEEQGNLNGNIVTVIGKPDTYLHSGLVDCNVIEE